MPLLECSWLIPPKLRGASGRAAGALTCLTATRPAWHILRTTDPNDYHAPISYVARVNRAIDHIMVDLTRPLRLEDIAAVAGFSAFHFHRIFKGYPESGVGFRVYGCCSSHFKRRILVLEPRTSMLS